MLGEVDIEGDNLKGVMDVSDISLSVKYKL
jgi:hypothetical protein